MAPRRGRRRRDAAQWLLWASLLWLGVVAVDAAKRRSFDAGPAWTRRLAFTQPRYNASIYENRSVFALSPKPLGLRS